MKLATKSSLNFLSVALFTFLFGIIAFYYTLRIQVDKFVNNELNKAKNAFFEQSDNLSSLEGTYLGACQLMPLKPTTNAYDTTVRFQDTLILDPQIKKFLPYRQMTFVISTKLSAFEVRIIRPLEETDRLIINLFLFMTLLVFLLILALLMINQYSSHQLWKDFYASLDKINKFDLDTHAGLEFPPTEIKEFEDLNTVFTLMSKRITSDYSRMKEYTENASHEIQTPLAIINAKMELLLQCKDLPEKQYQIIADASEAAERLARLNKTLILLTRIENRQFPEIETIYPQKIIEYQLENYEEIIQSRGIRLKTHFEPNISLQMNPLLSDILFLNLIKNAIRHNIRNGLLLINIDAKGMEIANSGAPLDVNPELLFSRFYKSTKSSKSLGLGLAIVKKITELFQLKIDYAYKENLHTIYLQFPLKTKS
ncbi:MAG: HAMP domain-containing histidine kinase [Bacteroidales bacterium]|nr:HAMP domain-containing histidine kinase [Bacteroidales bacterium]